MNDIAYQKSRSLAIRIIKLYRHLREHRQEYVLSRQLLRSGTSIGANLAEAKCAVSRADFLAKAYIALKETMETLYWLDLLHETEYLTDRQYSSIQQDVEEIRKMLSATTKTMVDE